MKTIALFSIVILLLGCNSFKTNSESEADHYNKDVGSSLTFVVYPIDSFSDRWCYEDSFPCLELFISYPRVNEPAFLKNFFLTLTESC